METSNGFKALMEEYRRLLADDNIDIPQEVSNRLLLAGQLVLHSVFKEHTENSKIHGVSAWDPKAVAVGIATIIGLNLLLFILIPDRASAIEALRRLLGLT